MNLQKRGGRAERNTAEDGFNDTPLDSISVRRLDSGIGWKWLTLLLVVLLAWQALASWEQPYVVPTVSRDVKQSVVITDVFATEAVVFEDNVHNQENSGKGGLTIQVGTHVLRDLDSILKQDVLCQRVAFSITELWMAFQAEQHSQARIALLEDFRKVAKVLSTSPTFHCDLFGDPSRGMVWGFPLSFAPDTKCPGKTTTDALRQKPWFPSTKFRFPWFLQRPDLVILEDLAKLAGIPVRFVIHLGHDPEYSCFNNELTCQRFRTILQNRDVYKQRLLLVGVMDLQHQTTLLESNVSVSFCSQKQLEVDLKEMDAEALKKLRLTRSQQSFWAEKVHVEEVSSCDARNGLSTSAAFGHLMTIANSPLVRNIRLPKTVFSGAKMVFIAGLEGVGHHLFYNIGRKHTFPFLYESLTNYLAVSAWNDQSEAKYAEARGQLVESVNRAANKGMDVVFLNTIWAGKPVNMYSFPWGGPKCKLKRFARVMCNIDLVELARIVEDAGVDFRVVYLERNMGSAVVSASLHRPFGTVESESHMLSLSHGLLRASLDSLDPRYYQRVKYEDLMEKPRETLVELNSFLGVEVGSVLDNQMHKRLAESAANRTANKWWTELTPIQLRYVLDVTRVQREGAAYERSMVPDDVMKEVASVGT